MALAQRLGRAALHDAEAGLRGGSWRREAAFGPGGGAGHGALDVGFGGLAWWAFVEGHGDVGAEEGLDLHRAFWREGLRCAVDVGAEDDAVVVDFAERGEGEDLIAA